MANGAMPSYETIRVDREDPLVWITFDRQRQLNAMNEQLYDELLDVLDRLLDDRGAKVITIRGAGRAFSAGNDIDGAFDEHRDITTNRRRMAGHIHRYLKLWDYPKPIIAAVHGYCLGAATQLCVFCDITVVAEDAQIGIPSIPLGGGYITPLWVHLIGPKRAKQMSFVAGSRIDGRTAAEWGWANYAVPAGELEDNVRALARGIAKAPSEVLEIKKLAINRVMDVQGLRTIAPMGAEMDALLHSSAVVEHMKSILVEHGIKETIRRYNEDELGL
jgi:enoyl-CoA hydratase